MDPEWLQLRSAPKQKRSLERMETILDAAAEVFAEHGYEKATTNEIARRANTSIGSLYRVFPDKLSVFRALCGRYANALDEIMEAVAKKHVAKRTVDAAVDEFMDRFESFVARNPAFETVFVFADAFPDLREIDNLNKNNGATRVAAFIRLVNPKKSENESFYIGRTLIQLMNSYLRMRLTVPEVPRAHARAQYQLILTAYLNVHVR